MNFERGKDPIKTMGIGKEAILKEIGGIIVSGKEVEKWENNKSSTEPTWFSAQNNEKEKINVVIKIENGQYLVLKNKILYDEFMSVGNVKDPILKGPESELFTLLKKLLYDFRKYGLSIAFGFPISQKVVAKTVGLDLVPVQPMSGPIGQIHYISYGYNEKSSKYNNKKIYKRRKK